MSISICVLAQKSREWVRSLFLQRLSHGKDSEEYTHMSRAYLWLIQIYRWLSCSRKCSIFILKASNGAHLIFCACVHQNVFILIYNVLWQVLIAFIYVMNSIFEICTHWFGQHVYVLMKKCLTSTLFWKIFWFFDTETIEWSLLAMNLMLENCHALTNYVPFSLNPSYFYSD